MTPSGLVESVVQRRLTMIDRLVGAAESRRGITGEELDRDFDTRLIVERILTQLADLAVDINAHILTSTQVTAQVKAGRIRESNTGFKQLFGLIGLIAAFQCCQLQAVIHAFYFKLIFGLHTANHQPVSHRHFHNIR